MQIKKVTTQKVLYSDSIATPKTAGPDVKLGIAGEGDSFEQRTALQPGSWEYLTPPRIQPKADLIIAARAKQLGEHLAYQMKQYGVEIDETALTKFSMTIMKGGKDGILNALGVTYAIAKLAAGPPQSDGIPELLATLFNNPEQAEELVLPMITDPEFIPISAEQLETMYVMDSLPFKGPDMISTFFGQILNQRMQEIEPLSQEQNNLFEKFDELIPSVFGSLGTERTIRLQSSF